MAYALRGMRYALLDASCFEGLQEPTAVGALARMLQAVAGRAYPPPLPHSMRLFQLLSGGRLDSVFTGGGCLVRRLPRCQGRYVLFIGQGDQARAEAQLARLPPLNAAEAARQQRRREQQAAAAVGGAGTDEEAGEEAALVAAPVEQ